MFPAILVTRGAVMDGRKLNVISHIGLTSKQLRDLAEEVKSPFLTYLLGMVALEAEKALHDGRRDDGIQAPRSAAEFALAERPARGRA
jgi:hypothetical protein